ncbi:MAG: amidohydrolase family protein [Thermofilaceae archaeon]
MKVLDCHVHATGGETSEELVREMDRYGIDAIVLFSPYPGVCRDEYRGAFEYSSSMQRASAEHVAKLQREHPDRIIGFLWLEPRLAEALEILEWAICSLELRGVKMIPYHWYPYDEKLLRIYEKIEELRVPIIFHSGILFGFEDSSRYCRPVNYEVLINFPRLKFALAHVSWPWIDECIALWGRFRYSAERTGRDVQMFIDATPGTPQAYRREAFAKLMAYGAHAHVMSGSDSTARNLAYSASVRERDVRMLREELGMPDSVIEAYLYSNAARFLGLK